MNDDIQKRVGKLEEDMGDLKVLIRGYWDGTTRVPGVLDTLQKQQIQIGTVLDEIQKRDNRHDRLIEVAWGLVKPIVAGVVAIVVIQLAILIARVGTPPHFP